MIAYNTAKTDNELAQIIELQQANLPINISAEESAKEGFVTLSHDLQLLRTLNAPFPHSIAKDGEQVVGYALVTIPEMIPTIPLLQSTIDELEGTVHNGKLVLDLRFFIMGQVCIDKHYRGRGIFADLYRHMRKEMATDFDIIITEIATDNTRSMRAHEKVGFEIVKLHKEDGKEWAIVGLTLTE